MTLRQQIAVGASVLSLLTIGVVAVAASVLARSSAAREAETELATTAQVMADRLDQHMFGRYRDLRNLVSFEPFRDLWTERPDRARAVLEQVRASAASYAWIGHAGLDGVVRVATGGMLEGVSVADRPWFVEGRNGRAFKDIHEAKLLATVLPKPGDGQPILLVDIALPVTDAAGRPAGVLGAHLDWSWAAEVRRRVMETQRQDLPTELWVLSNDGVVLLGPEPGQRPFADVPLAGLLPGATTTFRDDAAPDTVLTAAAKTQGRGDYPGLGWIVVARRPAAAAFADADRLGYTILAIGGAMASLGVALACLMAGHVARPITSLATAIDRVGRAGGMADVPRQHGSQEVLSLSLAIRALLRRVGTAEESARSAERKMSELARLADQGLKLAAKRMKAADAETHRLDADLKALRKIAGTDALTGLLNRRGFLPFAEDAMAQFQRYQRPVVVMMVDIDRFKAVNDTHGHAAGDRVLHAVARVLGDKIRASDKVARFGGEEFVLLLRETDIEGALTLAERIREAVEATAVEADIGTISVTVSAGVAAADRLDRDIDDVMRRADEALYAAKAGGRNRVEINRQPGLRLVSDAA